MNRLIRIILPNLGILVFAPLAGIFIATGNYLAFLFCMLLAGACIEILVYYTNKETVQKLLIALEKGPFNNGQQ